MRFLFGGGIVLNYSCMIVLTYGTREYHRYLMEVEVHLKTRADVMKLLFLEYNCELA